MYNRINSILLTKNHEEIEIARNYIKQNTEEFKYVTYSMSSDYNEYWYEMIHPNQNELYTEHAVFNKVQSWYMEAYA